MGNEFSDYTRRLERLVEVCRNLSANLELEPLLQSIVEVSAELTHSAGAYILIYDDESACLRYVAGPLYRMEELEAVGVALDGSAAGWVYRHSAPSVVHCGEDARLLALRNFVVGRAAAGFLAGQPIEIQPHFAEGNHFRMLGQFPQGGPHIVRRLVSVIRMHPGGGEDLRVLFSHAHRPAGWRVLLSEIES